MTVRHLNGWVVTDWRAGAAVADNMPSRPLPNRLPKSRLSVASVLVASLAAAACGSSGGSGVGATGPSAGAIDSETVWFTRDNELSAPSANGLDRLLSQLLQEPTLTSELVCGRPMQDIDQRKLTVYQCGLVLRYLTSRGVDRARIDYRLVPSPPGPQIDVAVRRGTPVPQDGSAATESESPTEDALPPKRTIF